MAILFGLYGAGMSISDGPPASVGDEASYFVDNGKEYAVFWSTALGCLLNKPVSQFLKESNQ
jgi:hypothetical protein